MPFRAEIYRVLIASPSDLMEERQVATETASARLAHTTMEENGAK